ncbi:hypothetical protein BH09MYX1_BH09MYX1_59120 [soil metagenome]
MNESRAFFDRIAARYDRAYAISGATSRALNDALCAILCAPKRILDLGVGTGRELTALREAGHTTVGLEIAPEMIALCNKRAHPIPITLGDLWAEWPFEASTFDAVIALHGTLAHPPAEAALADFFANARRVLAKGGIIVAELPTPAWLDHAHGSASLAPTNEDGIATARFTDEVNGARITIRLFDETRWRAAARGFALEFQSIGDAEVRFVAREVG